MKRNSVKNPDDDDDRIYLTRPVTGLRLAQILGVKPHEMLVELFKQTKVFGGHPKEVVSDPVAKQIARKHHRVLVIRDEHPKT